MNTTGTARFHYRLGANQPAASPTARRLAEMAEAIGRDTGGEFRLDVYPESRLGPDPQMFADLRARRARILSVGRIARRRRADQRIAADAVRVLATAKRCSRRSTARSATASAASLPPPGFMPSAARGRTAFTTSPTMCGRSRPPPISPGSRSARPGGEIAADFFRTLGAEAGMVPFSGMYDALKAKTFDGQSDPLGVVLSLRLYEVQRYLSLTAHWWTGFTLLANADAWQALPADIRAVVERHADSVRAAAARRYRGGQRRRRRGAGAARNGRQHRRCRQPPRQASAISTPAGGRASTRPPGRCSKTRPAGFRAEDADRKFGQSAAILSSRRRLGIHRASARVGEM